MDVDARDNSPTLPVVLGLVVTYTPRTSAAALRLAMRRHIPGAEELTKILDLLDTWIEHCSSAEQQLVRSVRTRPKDKSDVPALDKVRLLRDLVEIDNAHPFEDTLFHADPPRQLFPRPSAVSTSA